MLATRTRRLVDRAVLELVLFDCPPCARPLCSTKNEEMDTRSDNSLLLLRDSVVDSVRLFENSS